MTRREKKLIKKNRKDLIKRIKKMSNEQFEAYYATLVEIYGKESFYSNLAKRYVHNLKDGGRIKELSPICLGQKVEPSKSKK